MHTRVNRSLCANRSISCITQLLMLATKLKMTHLCNVSISAISPYGRSLLAGSLLWQEFQTLMTSTFMAHHCLVCCLATRPPSLTRNSFFLNVYLKPLLGLCFICENFQKFFSLVHLYFSLSLDIGRKCVWLSAPLCFICLPQCLAVWPNKETLR